MWGFSWKFLLPLEQYCQSHLMNLIRMIDCWRDDDEFCCKRIFIWQKNIRGFLENLTDNFRNIIVNVNFSGDLKFEYCWALPWNAAASKPSIRKYNWWEGLWNIFWENYWAKKYSGLWSPGLQNFFWKISKPSGPPPTYLMYAR